MTLYMIYDTLIKVRYTKYACVDFLRREKNVYSLQDFVSPQNLYSYILCLCVSNHFILFNIR